MEIRIASTAPSCHPAIFITPTTDSIVQAIDTVDAVCPHRKETKPSQTQRSEQRCFYTRYVTTKQKSGTSLRPHMHAVPLM